MKNIYRYPSLQRSDPQTISKLVKLYNVLICCEIYYIGDHISNDTDIISTGSFNSLTSLMDLEEYPKIKLKFNKYASSIIYLFGNKVRTI